MGKILLMISLVFFCSPIFAGSAIGKTTGYFPYSKGNEELIFVKVENYTNVPACNVTSRFTMASSNPKFQSINSALLSAFISGIKVKIKGYSTCDNFSNSEDIKYICLGDIPC